MLETHLRQLKTSKPTPSLWKHLIEFHSCEFPKWWDPRLFDCWDTEETAEDLYSDLCIYCNRYFDMWFDKREFCYEGYGSRSLCIYCGEHFDKWYDPQKFDWSMTSYLVFVSHKFDVWIKDVLARKSVYNGMLGELATHLPDKFEDWWKPDLVTDLPIYSFIENLPDKFDIWIKVKKVRSLSLEVVKLLIQRYKTKADRWMHLLKWYSGNKFALAETLSEELPQYIDVWFPIVAKTSPFRNILKHLDIKTLESVKLENLLGETEEVEV